MSEYFKLFFYHIRYGWLGYEIVAAVGVLIFLAVLVFCAAAETNSQWSRWEAGQSGTIALICADYHKCAASLSARAVVRMVVVVI